MATDKLKLTARFRNKTWISPPIKNHKTGHKLTDETTDTTQNPEHMHLNS